MVVLVGSNIPWILQSTAVAALSITAPRPHLIYTIMERQPSWEDT